MDASKSGIVTGCREEELLHVSPEFVAKRIVLGIRQRRKRVVIGADAHLLTTLQRLFPASYGLFFPNG